MVGSLFPLRGDHRIESCRDCKYLPASSEITQRFREEATSGSELILNAQKTRKLETWNDEFSFSFNNIVQTFMAKICWQPIHDNGYPKRHDLELRSSGLSTSPRSSYRLLGRSHFRSRDRHDRDSDSVRRPCRRIHSCILSPCPIGFLLSPAPKAHPVNGSSARNISRMEPGME